MIRAVGPARRWSSVARSAGGARGDLRLVVGAGPSQLPDRLFEARPDQAGGAVGGDGHRAERLARWAPDGDAARRSCAPMDMPASAVSDVQNAGPATATSTSSKEVLALYRRAELLVAFCKQIRIRTVSAPPWNREPHTLHLLESMLEHRPITLPQDVGPYFDDGSRDGLQGCSRRTPRNGSCTGKHR